MALFKVSVCRPTLAMTRYQFCNEAGKKQLSITLNDDNVCESVLNFF